MKLPLLAFSLLFLSSADKNVRKVFDVHLHGHDQIAVQLAALEEAGVYRAAVSTSWDLQDSYRGRSKIDFLYGLMFPCSEGRVPYSLQPCFSNGQDWPAIQWVEEQIKAGKIDFLGEVLSQYYGISSSDSLLFPYYALAQRYNLPVGIHTGGAGPNHGALNFKEELGNPLYLAKMLSTFPKLRVWIMHAGDSYYTDAITIMEQYSQVYADISVLSNPAIVSADRFATIMNAFVEAGLEDRLMFGTDNGNVQQVIAAVDGLPFLSKHQKDKIFFRNAERFFDSP